MVSFRRAARLPQAPAHLVQEFLGLEGLAEQAGAAVRLDPLAAEDVRAGDEDDGRTCGLWGLGRLSTGAWGKRGPGRQAAAVQREPA
jgi:hypothetical protein